MILVQGKTIDLSQVVSQAREAIRGKTLEEAILQLALIGRSPSTTVLRQHVEEIARQLPSLRHPSLQA